MAKYETQVQEIKNLLPNITSALVVLPAQTSVDKLAAGLTLFLSLRNLGIEVAIVSEDTLLVSHGNLFGVGDVKDKLPKGKGGGDLTLTLEGVVAADGTVPALEKLDWFPEGANLNLVFHVVPGQKFEPINIVPKQSGANFEAMFVIGAANLADLGNLYSQNQNVFNGNIVNIDNSAANLQFGKINLVDPESPSISEMIALMISAANLPFDSDMATNILTGIYNATSNLTVNVKPDTFMAVGHAMNSGGKNPTIQAASVIQQAQSAPAYNFPPLNQVLGFPVPAATQVTQQPDAQVAQSQVNTPVLEEGVKGEFAYTTNPEMPNPAPDWLAPKIFKGSSTN